MYQTVGAVVAQLLFWLLCAGFIAFIGYSLYVWYIHKKYDHIPGPPRDNFFLGHIPTFVKETNSGRVVHDTFLQWAEMYGPVYRINSFHSVALVVTCPEATKEFLMSPKYSKDPFVYKRLFHLFGKRFLGNGLITAMNHDLWYKQRRIMDPAFSSSYLRGLMGTFNERAECLMDRLGEIAEEQTTANMHKLVNSVTLDVICKVAFGVDLDLLKNHDSPFPNAIELCLNFFYFRNYLNDSHIKLKSAVERGEDVPKDILTQILKTAGNIKYKKTNYLSEFVSEKHFLCCHVSGQETTANQLSFAIMELGRHPEILQKAKEEVDEVIGTKHEILYDDLGKLTYLSQVLKETLRLYATAPGTSRWLHEDSVISGFKIPAGCAVLLSSYISSRMDKFFKDPLKFDPERFNPTATKPYFCYYPFALGPRSCLGQVFSQVDGTMCPIYLSETGTFVCPPGSFFYFV
uniref:Cytochrome P450, family 46, subfamily A, polypeptide 1, tandem duplicate 4 n=1 Tax=Astyanax mexicanus TaxID=7994 RepID=A0A8B9H0Y7_ASTMX